MSEEQQNNWKRLAITKGIQPHLSYSVLDVREVTNSEGKNRLVRLKNPWANSVEWSGSFGD